MKSIKSIITLAFLFCLAATSISCSNNSEENTVFIDNGQIRLGFNKNTGAFTDFRDLVNSHDYLDEIQLFASPWEVDITDASGTVTLDINSASKLRISKPDPLTLIFRWKKFKGAENKNIEIRATVTLDAAEALSAWKISLHGLAGRQVSRLVYPKVAGIKDMGDEYMAVPQWMGQIIKNPRLHLSKMQTKEKKYEWSYPGPLSLQ
jgi:hypothetical protein